MNDREWDIFMMEVEEANIALIEEFMVSKMRPRDLEAILQQTQQPQQVQQQPEVLDAQLR